MDVSIILVGYYNYGLLSDCLHLLYDYTKGVTFEVIVVDNASSQQGKELILSQFPSVQWLDMGYNAGFSRANNKGIVIAKGKYILLLNADTLLTDNSILLHCVFRLNRNPSIAACGVQQLNQKGEIAPLYKSFSFRRTFFIVPTHPFFNKLLEILIPENKYPDPAQVDWLSGAFLFVRKAAIEKAGKMDEDFFLYAEDVEWCHRLGKQGSLVYFNDLQIYHLENEDNPNRASGLSFVNRFQPQIQVSNLLWIRKQYGLFSYLVLIIHYLSLIPMFYGWKIVHNLFHFRPPLQQLENQKAFTQKTMKLLDFFWDTVFLRKKLYQV